MMSARKKGSVHPRKGKMVWVRLGAFRISRQEVFVEASSPLVLGREQRVMRKVRLRILPFLATHYFIAFLDQANVVYAKLTMAPDLRFSELTYGFGAGLFFLGYLLLEIPGALMVCWGFCALALSFVHTAASFYVGRFLLGVAEGGLFQDLLSI
jgi:ACS family tartrate transporter-like MFS transporter